MEQYNHNLKFDMSLELAKKVSKIARISEEELTKEINNIKENPSLLTRGYDEIAAISSIAASIIAIFSVLIQWKNGDTMQGLNNNEITQIIIDKVLTNKDLTPKQKHDIVVKGIEFINSK